MALNSRLRRGRSPAIRGWSIPQTSPATDPRRRRSRTSAPLPSIAPEPPESPGKPSTPSFDTILDDFARGWERGERPEAERYLGLLSFEESTELIYHEFCLAEGAKLEPDPADYLRRFPEHAQSLSRLFAIHGVFSSSELREWARPAELPSSHDEIGPYRLLRELGRGAFARVFLAEQANLDDRLVVLKVSTRSTAEPQLLARARHAHIVEVLYHATTDDGALHLVCMPFLGGATLASILEERRRRKRRPRSGLDLLSDLDRVSASEYPSTELARPTREIIAGLSYAQALAWIVARLAEALDHAHQRGVAHGDLKPSNVLLTAEASPLLLDFNLSVDWRGTAPGDASDLGGTLAYMAPERLEAISRESREWTRKANDLHRADLYGLGLVLLEALTGQPPEVPRQKAANPRELAGDLARLRRCPPASLGSGGDRSIPPALRSILARCLATDPLNRYARGNDLAEDLDRWRSNRPLAFADEPRSSVLTRRVRRRRAPLIAFGLSMSAALLISFFLSKFLQGTQRDQALAKYSMIIDRADPELFRFRQGQARVDEPGDRRDVASRQLARYEVLGDPQWREREDIRSLPDRERGELEVWLFEQILRYTVALGETDNSPESWRRGLALLDRTLERVQSEPLHAQRRVLLDRLQQPHRDLKDQAASRLPRWMNAYLAGIAAEPLQAREAMGHYLEALKDRPDFFWGHYRTTVVACRINEYEEATRQLRYCSGRSPNNPAFHSQLASVLYFAARDMPRHFQHDPFGEALLEADRALKLDPDFLQAYLIRMQILIVLGQKVDLVDEFEQHPFLSLRTGYDPFTDLRRRLLLVSSNYGSRIPQKGDKLEQLNRKLLEINPSDCENRSNLASNLSKANRPLEAINEYNKVLALDPDYLRARWERALELDKIDHVEAIKEYRILFDNPRFEELFCIYPEAIRAYHYVATDLMERRQIDEAIDLAQRSLVHVNRARALSNETIMGRRMFASQPLVAPRGETYYLLARIHHTASTISTIDPKVRREHFDRSVECLKQSIATTPNIRKRWFVNDRVFDVSREEICRRLDQPDNK